MRRLVLILILGIVAAAIVWASGSTVPPVPADIDAAPVAKPATDEPVTPTKVAEAAPDPAQPAPADHPGWIVYPDGSERPPLNGVPNAPRMAWHRRLPFTPVVRVERDAGGRDWYVHENGARSTTYIDVRGVAIAEISLPASSQPLVDEPTPRTPK